MESYERSQIVSVIIYSQATSYTHSTVTSRQRARERERNKKQKNITSASNLSAIPLNEGVLFSGTVSVPLCLLQCEWLSVRLMIDTTYFSFTSPKHKLLYFPWCSWKKAGIVSTLKEKVVAYDLLKGGNQPPKKTDFLRVLQWQFLTLIFTVYIDY